MGIYPPITSNIIIPVGSRFGHSRNQMKHARSAPYHPQTQGKIERYHESLNNVTPADMYYGKARQIFTKRDRIKRETLKLRKYHNLGQYVNV